MTRIPVRQVLAGYVNESEFQRVVIDLARGLGWGITVSAQKAIAAEAAGYNVPEPELDGLIFHPRYSLGSEAGWPDLTLIRRRDRRLIFAELKAEKGKPSHRQEQVLDLLRCLETPLDFDQGDVVHPFRRREPSIQVVVWRPSDLDTIREELL